MDTIVAGDCTLYTSLEDAINDCNPGECIMHAPPSGFLSEDGAPVPPQYQYTVLPIDEAHQWVGCNILVVF
jgi:hypothetical protein